MNTRQWYEKVKDNHHIFVYSVGGRASSTALQRFLNSSNEVCIHGEPHLIIDKIIDLMTTMRVMTGNPFFVEDWYLLNKCFEKNKHDSFYPNAIRDLDPYIECISYMVSGIYKPVNGVERFGFKAVRLKSINTLEGLRRLFPNCHFVFLFRNPAQQWPSLKGLNWFPYAKDLNKFLPEYTRLSQAYMEFAKKDKRSIFVENSRLYGVKSVRKLLGMLDISSFDESLIDRQVHSVHAKSLMYPIRMLRMKIRGGAEHVRIKNSRAQRMYVKMRQISDKTFD